MDLNYLQKEVRKIIPSCLGFEIASIKSCLGKLDQTETYLLKNRSERRKHEIIAGRRLSRNVASTLGLGYITVQADDSGRPVWPSDLIGSISHKSAYVTVLIAKRSDYVSVGVDIEKLTKLSSEQYSPFASATEVSEFALVGLPSSKLPSLVLSVKEAIYKCLMMSNDNITLSLRDVKPKLSVNCGVLNVRCEANANIVDGALFVHNDCVISCVWMDNNQKRSC